MLRVKKCVCVCVSLQIASRYQLRMNEELVQCIVLWMHDHVQCESQIDKVHI